MVSAPTHLLPEVTRRRLNSWERMEGDGRHRETAVVPCRSEMVKSRRRRSIEKVLIVDVWGWLRWYPPSSRLVGVSVVGPEGGVLLARLLHLRLLGRWELSGSVMWRGTAGEHRAHRRLVVAHVHWEWHGNRYGKIDAHQHCVCQLKCLFKSISPKVFKSHKLLTFF